MNERIKDGIYQSAMKVHSSENMEPKLLQQFDELVGKTVEAVFNEPTLSGSTFLKFTDGTWARLRAEGWNCDGATVEMGSGSGLFNETKLELGWIDKEEFDRLEAERMKAYEEREKKKLKELLDKYGHLIA